MEHVNMTLASIFAIGIGIVAAIGGICCTIKVIRNTSRGGYSTPLVPAFMMLMLGLVFITMGASTYSERGKYEAEENAISAARIVTITDKSAKNTFFGDTIFYLEYIVDYEYTDSKDTLQKGTTTRWVSVPSEDFRDISIGESYDIKNYRIVAEAQDL